MPNTVLSEKDKQFIRDNRLKMSSRKLAEHIGCSRSPIQGFMRKYGLTPPKEIIEGFRREAMTGRTSFSQKETEYVIANYLKLPVKTIAKDIGRSYAGVMTRLNQLGLEIPPEIIEKRKRESRFSKGQKSFNKGRKQTEYMSKEAIEKTKATRFRKGHKPHNTKRDGVISLRKDQTGAEYEHIRISEGVWELHHRVIWEIHHGPIPEKHVVVFKDGNTRNVTIENLELITMVENMYRNSVHEYPKEIIPSLVLNKKLESKLKQLQNG